MVPPRKRNQQQPADAEGGADKADANRPAAGAFLPVEERAARLLDQARELAGRVASGEEFRDAIFAPQVGLSARAFPTLRERREFTLTPQYAEIHRIFAALLRKFGAAPGARSPVSHAQAVRMQRQAAQEDGQERTP